MTDEIIDVEIVEEAEVLPAVTQADHAPAIPTNLFNAATPEQVLEHATAQARVLKDVIVKQGLSSNIQGREHVNVEGWTTLGAMLGVFPVVEWTRKLDDGGWEARVVATTRDGAIVGAAEAMCSRSEKTWAKRDDYALRSMAQTRATSKALRLPLGFVMQLAGYNPTPLEEMDFARSEKPSTPTTYVTDFPDLLIRGQDRDATGRLPEACPYCMSDVEHHEPEGKDDRKPRWKCSNRECQGGGEKKGGGRWPWASWHLDPWEPGGEIDQLLDDDETSNEITRTDYPEPDIDVNCCALARKGKHTAACPAREF